MIQIEFSYQQNLTTIQGNLTDLFKESINKYVQKVNLDINNTYFVTNGKKINPEKTIESQIGSHIKNEKICRILVFSSGDEKKIQNENNFFVEANEIICPKCFEPCRIKFENYKINLYDCINGHITEEINLNKFKDSQKIDLSKIICQNCKDNNKGNTYGNEFYRCLNCNINICPICKNYHDKTHNIIIYEKKYFVCHNHYDFFIKYCKNCKKNLCFSCEESHNEHETMFFEKPNLDEINKKLSEIKTNIDSFKNKIKQIIEKLNALMKLVDIYYEIKNNINYKYDTKNRNFEILQNLKEINTDDSIINKINEINKNNDFYGALLDIFELYNHINLDKKDINNSQLDIFKQKLFQDRTMNFYSLSLSMKQSEIIFNQMKNCFCAIYKLKKKIGTGFISRLSVKNDIIPVLIAHSTIFSAEDIGKEIQLELFDGKQKTIKIIYLGFRKIFINKDFCLAVIELQKNLDKINYYIELENDMFIQNSDKNELIKLFDKYFKEDVYTLKTLNNEIYMSIGNMKKLIKEDLSEKTEDYFLPIISSKSNKLIGIYSNKFKDDFDNYLCIEVLKNSLDEFAKIIISSKKTLKVEKSISIFGEKKLHELSMIYNTKNCFETLRLFGTNFVIYNKDKCYLIIDQQKSELFTNIILNKNQKLKNKLEIKLIIVKHIDNMSYMFESCTHLLSISGFSSLDFQKITNISNMFYNCSSLESLTEPPKNVTNMNDLFNMKSLDISSWNIKNVSDMSSLFAGCESLKSLPDISKWKTDCVTNMSSLFAKCSLLKSLPDISKWNTKHVDDMSYMFSNCSSLKTLPDLSKWDTRSVINMCHMFDTCISLSSLPDISGWNTKNVTNINNLFNHCQALISLPNIYKWDTKNVTEMSFLFADCANLKSLPDISKWDLSRTYNLSYMFKNCKSLKILPDISKWNIKNVSDLSYMFSLCESLTSLPDISKWDVKNVTDMSFLFYECSKLESLPDISKWKVNSNLKTVKIFGECKKKIIPKKYEESNCAIY